MGIETVVSVGNSDRADEDTKRRDKMQAEIELGIDCQREYFKRFKETKDDWWRLNGRKRMETKFLETEQEMISAVEANDISFVRSLDSCVTADDYEQSLRTLTKLENVLNSIEIRKFDLFNTQLVLRNDATDGLESYRIHAPGFHDYQPSNFIIMQTTSKTWMDVLKIERVRDDEVILKRSAFRAEKYKDERMNISFIPEAYRFKNFLKAIDRFHDSKRMPMIAIENKYIRSRLDEQNKQEKIALSSTNTAQLRGRLGDLDSKQRQAVLGILRGQCWPRAYIIHGSPGSGKSHTIVEAVIQIFKRSELSILVCVSTNFCADDIIEKLRKNHLPASCILRLTTIRYNFDYRIIVATNLVSSKLMGKKTFDYVIIDQVNHLTAVESLTPISLLKYDGCLVLAGDPCSISANIRSRKLVEMNYQKSLLERIIKFKEYKKCGAAQLDNGDYITELTQSHRVDMRIMAPLNRLFYNEQVISSEKTPRSLLKILQLTGPIQFLKVLGQESQPDLKGSISNEIEANACVDIILRLYKIGLEPDQIGVMSPFRLQAELIKSKLATALETNAALLNRRFPMRYDRSKGERSREKQDERNLLGGIRGMFNRLMSLSRLQNDEPDKPDEPDVPDEPDEPDERNWLCKVGRIESFQGIEREVIIISTVASPDSVDSADFSSFVSSRGHFNLAISRAKWLLIVVGNLDALNRGEYLPELMANGHTDEIEKWPIQPETSSPFEHESPLFNSDRAVR